MKTDTKKPNPSSEAPVARAERKPQPRRRPLAPLPEGPYLDPETGVEIPEQVERILTDERMKEYTLPSGRITLKGLSKVSRVRWAPLYYLARQLNYALPLERRVPGRGHRLAGISIEEARTVLTYFLTPRYHRWKVPLRPGEKRFAKLNVGYFYLVQLEPQLDPGRYKAGWTGTLANRLSEFLCSTPFGEYLHYWPCDRRWELTARTYVTNGSEQIREEVYRARDINAVIIRAAQFFLEMPDPRKLTEAVIPSVRGQR